LLLDWKLDNFFALGRATTIELLRTLFALYEKQMTSIVLAVGMIVTWPTALVTSANDVVRNAFS
jgi:hypothetical protein